MARPRDVEAASKHAPVMFLIQTSFDLDFLVQNKFLLQPAADQLPFAGFLLNAVRSPNRQRKHRLGRIRAAGRHERTRVANPQVRDVVRLSVPIDDGT